MVRATDFRLPCPAVSPVLLLIGDVWPHARTRAGRGCRSRELWRSQTSRQYFRVSCWLFQAVRIGSPGLGVVRTGSLDVSDDRSGLVVHELDANLGNTTTRSCCPARRSILAIAQQLATACSRSRGQGRCCVPVRPRTRVTLTSLTGCFDASILVDV